MIGLAVKMRKTFFLLLTKGDLFDFPYEGQPMPLIDYPKNFAGCKAGKDGIANECISTRLLKA